MPLEMDRINNVENMFVRNPQPGTWTITVSAGAIGNVGHDETPVLDAD